MVKAVVLEKLLGMRQVIKFEWATSPRICLKFRLLMVTESLICGTKRKAQPSKHIPGTPLVSMQRPGGNPHEEGQPCLCVWQNFTVPWTLCKEISIWILSLDFSYFFSSFPTWLLPEDLSRGWGQEARWGLVHGSLQTPVSEFYLNLWFRCFHFLPFWRWTLWSLSPELTFIIQLEITPSSCYQLLWEPWGVNPKPPALPVGPALLQRSVLGAPLHRWASFLFEQLPLLTADQ